jgi:hypothetical protein
MEKPSIATLEFMKALSNTKGSNIIPILEKGIEIEKMEYIATQDIDSLNRISDACVLLSFLYFELIIKKAES